MFSLKDKVALVTGASQGIGRDTALALTEAGAKVVVAARNEEKLAALVGEIVLAGGQALAVKMDVADTEQVRAGFKQVMEKFARLDILVNNAAITHDGLSAARALDRLQRIDPDGTYDVNHVFFESGRVKSARSAPSTSAPAITPPAESRRGTTVGAAVATFSRSAHRGRGRVDPYGDVVPPLACGRPPVPSRAARIGE